MNSSYMDEALSLAAKGIGLTSPNPAVGAVLVRDGEIVGRGFHTYSGVAHAEVIALKEAGDKAQGATLYVTLEPCCHTGRTGPCTEALIAAGVSRVVTAMEDPNPIVGGNGHRRLRDAGIAVDFLPEFSAKAAQMNEAFVHFMRTKLPLVTVKSAVTLDGKIAAPEDNGGWITSETARRHVQTLRHQSDAILTGIGTVVSDDCRLTDRSGLERSRPLLRIVLDSQLRIPPTSKMVEGSKRDLLIVTTSAAPAARRKILEDRGVEVLTLDGRDGRTDLRGLLNVLAERKCLSLMVEAGSKVNWAFFETGVADKIFFYYAPKILGGLHSLPVAGGAGRKRRKDAINFRNVKIHSITTDEFAVEAWLVREF
ncbi:MAG TPA: bifunctional diaminohydroxyphosphoribosylaminopyrimidine deaminase/5-amino-6-(5-phosphoribosylamino)uracil reductase RibD [Bryobacteraceae bacterium]|jgi:diaminohydroxyphosphoribosylaminopyrimidine deaminase/5-amino-6-(5-phosphoribosylamino)uracil reductase